MADVPVFAGPICIQSGFFKFTSFIFITSLSYNIVTALLVLVHHVHIWLNHLSYIALLLVALSRFESCVDKNIRVDEILLNLPFMCIHKFCGNLNSVDFQLKSADTTFVSLRSRQPMFRIFPPLTSYKLQCADTELDHQLGVSENGEADFHIIHTNRGGINKPQVNEHDLVAFST